MNAKAIPDQRHQLRAYCQAKGMPVVAEFIEPGALRRMMRNCGGHRAGAVERVLNIAIFKLAN
jgi:hypothetical protein